MASLVSCCVAALPLTQVQAAEAGAFLLFSHSRHFSSIIRFHSPLPPCAMRVVLNSRRSDMDELELCANCANMLKDMKERRAQSKPKRFKIASVKRELEGG